MSTVDVVLRSSTYVGAGFIDRLIGSYGRKAEFIEEVGCGFYWEAVFTDYGGCIFGTRGYIHQFPSSLLSLA
jgi:hypothetical protein